MTFLLQRGHVLDLSRDLMQVQSWRISLITYLTDTRRFQFFKTERQADGSLIYYSSDLMQGKKGWAYWIALHEQEMGLLGFTPPKLKKINLKCLLASSSKSVVFSAAPASAKAKAKARDEAGPDEVKVTMNTDYAVKIILDSRRARATDDERRLTSQVFAAVTAFKVANRDVPVASVFPVLQGAAVSCTFRGVPCCPVIVLVGVGQRVQPARDGEVVRGADIAKLVRLLQVVHEGLQIVHRDIKPDNIVMVDGEIYLLDWGSAAAAHVHTPYVATSGFRLTGSIAMRAPKPEDDLLQLARSAYCMLFNRQPLAPILCKSFATESNEWSTRLASQLWQDILSASRARKYDELIGLYQAIK